MAPDQHAIADVMVTRPRTFGPTTRVADLRAFFDDDHVHAALVVDGDRLLSVIVRRDLEPADGSTLATDLPTADRTIGPDADAETTRLDMLERGIRRLAVVDGSRRLLGLLCLKRSGRGFCSDTDVAARAADHTTGCAQDVSDLEVRVGTG